MEDVCVQFRSKEIIYYVLGLYRYSKIYPVFSRWVDHVKGGVQKSIFVCTRVILYGETLNRQGTGVELFLYQLLKKLSTCHSCEDPLLKSSSTSLFTEVSTYKVWPLFCYPHIMNDTNIMNLGNNIINKTDFRQNLQQCEADNSASFLVRVPGPPRPPEAPFMGQPCPTAFSSLVLWFQGDPKVYSKNVFVSTFETGCIIILWPNLRGIFEFSRRLWPKLNSTMSLPFLAL